MTGLTSSIVHSGQGLSCATGVGDWTVLYGHVVACYGRTVGCGLWRGMPAGAAPTDMADMLRAVAAVRPWCSRT